MPIYLVRWPTFAASLVRADDEDELVELIDQTGNPDWCTWSVYDGPLAIDFRLPVLWSLKHQRAGEPVAPEQIVIEDVGRLAAEYVISTVEVEADSAEVGVSMLDAVVEQAFPNVHAAVEELFSEEGIAEPSDGVLPETSLRRALLADLAPMLSASWRRAQLGRKTDLVSAIAREMDMPIALVRRIAAAALDANGESREPDAGQ